MARSGSPAAPTFLLPPLTLVIGGAKSGKSLLAERLCMASARPRAYLATAQAFDDEMRTKIADHRLQRGPEWRTVEAPMDLPGALAGCPSDEVVLLDCATLWLTNHLLAGSDLAAHQAGLLAALAACRAPVIVVSNEVGWSVVPENKLARQFTAAQGRLNQALAQQAGLVVAVMAGLPLALKGTIEGFA